MKIELATLEQRLLNREKINELLPKAFEGMISQPDVPLILSSIFDGGMECMLVSDGQEVVGVVAATLSMSETNPAYVVVAMAADIGTLEAIGDELHRLVVERAVERKCTSVEWVGRMGWMQYAKKHGFGVEYVTFAKKIEV